MSEFSDYVTSTAFNLSISKSQIRALCMVEFERTVPEIRTEALEILHMGTLHALKKKGLIYWVNPNPEPDVSQKHGPYISREGELVVQLIRLAGLYPVWIDKARERHAA